MAAVDPGAYGPPPHEINSNLIEQLHRAIRLHPHYEAKANYGKILAQLLQQQSKAMAARQALGEQASQDNNGAYTGPGAVADASGFPSNWADVARGNPPPPMIGPEHLALLGGGAPDPLHRASVALALRSLGGFGGVHGPVL